MTNLRLPGQYDERRLGSLGLQGPYYNWNRWYLPTVGRYMELDPIAMVGGFNTEYGVDWYKYAEGNPLSNTDFDALSSQMCFRDVMLTPLAWAGARHCYIQFNHSTKSTISYWADGFNDDTPHVGDDGDPNNRDRVCHNASDDDKKDQCLRDAMKECEGFTYQMDKFNCCDCVARAFAKCDVPYGGPWPKQPFAWGPPRPMDPKRPKGK